MDADQFLLVAGTFIGATAVFGIPYYVRHRILFGSAKDRRKREETKEQNLRSLDALVTVDEMDRLWYNSEDNCYRDYTGREILTQPLGQTIRKNRLYDHKMLDSLLMEMVCKGKALKADAYSLSSPQDIHGEYTFGVLYHRLQEAGSKPELRLVDSVAKHK